MKKRRNLIIALLLVATLALTIGYALTTELTITGSVTNAPVPVNVVYTNTCDMYAVDGDHDIAFQSSNVICTAGAKSATMSVAGLEKKDDFVVAKFEVENKNTYSVQMEDPTATNTAGNKTFYTVTCEWVDDTDTKIAAPNLAPGQKATFTVKVTLNEILTAEKLTGDFMVSIPGESSN